MLGGIKKTIQSYNMLSEGDRVLIGLSGGPDSICLLYILKQLSLQYKLKLYIAHLNHGLRGREADMDQRFCEELGREMDIPVFTKRVKIKKGEDAARRVRYEFLENTAKKIGATKIALGHNADDQVETVLMRLLRGAGVRGLSGIPPVRGLIIRPLINVWREEILDYLKKRDIPYRVDSTNLQLGFFRNRIRHELIPFLSKYNPNIKNVLQNTGRNMAMLNEYIEDVVSAVIARHEVPKQSDLKGHPEQSEGSRWNKTRSLVSLGMLRRSRLLRSFQSLAMTQTGVPTINIKRLGKLHPAIRQEVIRKIVGNLPADHVDNIMALAGGTRGSKSIVLPKGIKVIREYNRLIFSKGECVKIFGRNILVSSRICKMPRKIQRNPFEVCLDYDKISVPLIIRGRRPGDVFQPIGLEGKKKVKDIFIDEKVPKRFRDLIPLVVSGNEICWIPGYRIGEKFKIGPETKRVVKIKIEGVEKLWQS